MNVTSRICSDRWPTKVGIVWQKSKNGRKMASGQQQYCTLVCTLGHAPHPHGNFLHFLFSDVAFSAFSGKTSAQNLINYIKILTAIINSYQSCSNSNDPLNILHECCDTNLLMISFNYMSTKRGGSGPPGPPPWICPCISIVL